MTDEQLVLAVIRAYKDRGIDTSAILDDPLFAKLSPHTKIKAIQQHASLLHEGVGIGIKPAEYGRIASSSVFTGLTGALAGYGMGAALGASLPTAVGVTGRTAAMIGAGLLGLTGAAAGALNVVSSIDDRRLVKQQLETAKNDPTASNAVGVLSTKHMSSTGRTLRDRILEQITGQMVGNMNSHLPAVINAYGVSKTNSYLQANPQHFQKAP